MGIFGSSQPGQPRYSGELHNLQLTQAVFGTTATVIHGTDRVAGKLLFYGGFYAVNAPNSGGKGGGGKGDQEYDYYADCQLLLASGSASGGCQGILNVWDQQGRLVNQSGSYVYTVPGGGGSVTPQGAGAPLIQMDLGVSRAAAYSVVANDFGSGGSRTLSGTQYVGMQKVTGTPAAGQYAFNAGTGTYTFAAADAGAVVTISYSTVFSLYYFSTVQPAEVPLLSPWQVSTTNQAYFWQNSEVVRVDTGDTLTYGTDYTESSGVYTFNSALAGVQVYITYTYTSSDSSVTNTASLNLTFFGGSLGQAPNSYWQSKYPGSAFGYPGICHVDANPMALGESAVLPQYNYEVVGLNIFPGGGLDAHFCDVFRTHLYDAFLGVGFPSANVDSWTSCYAYWAANGYLGKIKLDTQTSVANAMKEVIETGNVGAVWSGGLLKLIPYGDSTCVGNGYTYTPSTMPAAVLTLNDLLPSSEKKAGESGSDDPVEWEIKAPQDCWNYVQAQYCNRENDYNNELINEQNDAFIAKYGRRIEASQTWDWITTSAAAQWALNLRLKRQCYITNTCKFWLSYRHAALEPMDMVTLPTGENVRITQITDDAQGRLAIEAEQWTYGSSTASIYAKQGPSSFQPTISSALPGDSIPIVVQSSTAQSNGIGNQILISASGQSQNWGGCFVDLSLDNQSFTTIGKVNAPGVIGMLSAALPSAGDPDTGDTLALDISLSALGNADAQLVSVTQQQADSLVSLAAIVDASGTNELISYETATLTAANRYNLTYLRRGVYGTAIAAHSAGAWFAYLGVGYSFLEYYYNLQNIGQTIYIRLRSFNLAGLQTQQAAQVAVWQFVIGSEGSNVETTGALRPTTSSPTLVGAGSVANAAYAYDENFATGAVIASGSASLASSAKVTYSGFGSGTTSKPMTLYVNYSNLAVTPSSGFGGGFVSVAITSGGTFLIFRDPESGSGNPTQAAGTITYSLPAGTSLSGFEVAIAAANGGAGTGNTGTVQINEIWMQ